LPNLLILLIPNYKGGIVVSFNCPDL